MKKAEIRKVLKSRSDEKSMLKRWKLMDELRINGQADLVQEIIDKISAAECRIRGIKNSARYITKNQ